MSNTQQKSELLYVSGIVSDSIVDGEGLRLTVFTQGCPHNCPGCQNPETHPFSGGKEYTVDAIVEKLQENPLLDGITLSGGDPICQAEALLPLVKKVKSMGLTVWCYTGYTYEQLLNIPMAVSLLQFMDVLVDGPFIQNKKSLDLLYRGSSNQRIIDVPKTLATQSICLWQSDF